jgi:serine protease AprX
MHFRISRSLRPLLVAMPLLLFFWWLGGVTAIAQEEIPAANEPLAAIAPALARSLSKTEKPVSFLVILDAQPNPEGFLARSGLRTADRTAKGEAIYRYLTGFARRSQAPLRIWLDKQGIAYRSFYIVNAIEVKGDASLALRLRSRADVNRLAANPNVTLSLVDRPTADSRLGGTVDPPPDPPYGIRYANAPVVWAQGYRGEGIVIASQDTGVDWTHPALRDSYRGWDTNTQTVTHPYNWFDYWGTANRQNCDPDPQVPCDDFGHGTHTVGTMVGDDPRTGLISGMAPGADWIGCRNMNVGNGTPASYMGCFEFFLAPFPQNGDPQTDGVPSKAPHIINNSWYCPPSEGCDYDSLRQVVQNVRAAGQLIVVSAGNDGPGCSTVQYPITAYPEVFSVGAHNGSGGIAGFSSRGPVTVDGSGRMKPAISAAGDSVLSTVPGGGYGNSSGTSMASPHVAGATALLWSAAPRLIGHLDETEQILMKSATPVLHNGCREGPEPVSPNNTYGHGRLNAAAAVSMALHPGVITATVNGVVAPLAGITVTLTDKQTSAARTGQTNGAGQVVFSRVYSGTYGLIAAGVWTSKEVGVAIQKDEAKQVEIILTKVYYFPRVFGGGAP